MFKIFQKNGLFHPEMILSPLFCFKDTKDTGLFIFNSLKQKKLIVNFVANRNWKKLTDSRKRAKILADNRKSYHPIETLLKNKAKPNNLENEYFAFYHFVLVTRLNIWGTYVLYYTELEEFQLQ